MIISRIEEEGQINFSIPQILISNTKEIIVLTSGDENDTMFEGTVIAGNAHKIGRVLKTWSKSQFERYNPLYKIILQNNDNGIKEQSEQLRLSNTNLAERKRNALEDIEEFFKDTVNTFTRQKMIDIIKSI